MAVSSCRRPSCFRLMKAISLCRFKESKQERAQRRPHVTLAMPDSTATRPPSVTPALCPSRPPSVRHPRLASVIPALRPSSPPYVHHARPPSVMSVPIPSRPPPIHHPRLASVIPALRPSCPPSVRHSRPLSVMLVPLPSFPPYFRHSRAGGNPRPPCRQHGVRRESAPTPPQPCSQRQHC